MTERTITQLQVLILLLGQALLLVFIARKRAVQLFLCENGLFFFTRQQQILFTFIIQLIQSLKLTFFSIVPLPCFVCQVFMGRLTIQFIFSDLQPKVCFSVMKISDFGNPNKYQNVVLMFNALIRASQSFVQPVKPQIGHCSRLFFLLVSASA